MTKSNCLPRNRLKEYLNGWISTELQSEIESHLQECPECEKTIVDLESDPDTLLEVLHTPLNPSEMESAAKAAAQDAIVAYAIARASQNVPDFLPEPGSNADRPSADGPPKTIGPYSLHHPLGHGGMGAVFLAKHQELGKQVAIKLLPERAFRNDPYAARFQREIRTAGKLSHPAIVNATDAGTSQGMHYLVMEYIDGLDLSRIARGVGPLPCGDACKVAHTVALGLAYAHAEGIVHRDIKPSNVMLSRSGQVKILDFGLAQTELWEEASAELTTVGQLMGTLDYMAPEQAEKANGVDYRADLYSLGATLFRLLVGRAPLAATPNLSPLAKLRLLATSDPPSLGVLRPDLPKPLVDLVDRLLHRDPSARPASAAHVAEALEPLSEGADLEELVRQAELLSKSKVELAKPHGTEEAPSWLGQQQTNAAGRSNRRRFGNWIALALFPLFAFAGILIAIETSKGQLVIESEAANIEVKLLKDGKEYETIQVLPGTQSTRLLAGKYEIIVDSASDQFSIDHDQVEVKRGQTLIARITSKAHASKESVPGNLPSRATLAGDELMYEGKTLDEWLKLLEIDRSVKTINESLRAIKALITKQTAERVANRLLAILPELDGKLVLPEEPNEASVHLDYKVALILRQCYPDPLAWTKKLCAEVEASEDPFAIRLLSNWLLFRLDHETPPLDATTFLYWSLDKVFSVPGRSQLVLPTANILRAMLLYPGYALKHSDQLVVIEKLQQSSAIPKSFFFEMIPDTSSGAVWSPVWANAVQRQAIDVLQDGKSIESEKLMAATMLRLLRQNKQGIRMLDEIKDASGIAATNIAELLRLSQNPEDLLRTCVVTENYRSEVLPGIDPAIGREPIDLGLSYNMTVSGEEVRGNLALEYIRLWRVLPIEKEEHFRQAMQSVVDVCLPNVIELMMTMEGNPYGMSNTPNRAFSMGWPRLEVWGGLGQSTPKYSGTPAMWMSQFLFQEAMVELLSVDPSKQSIVDDLKLQWCERMVKRFDEDRNGTTSLEEGEAGIRTHIWRGFGRSKEESISIIDANGNGKLDGSELHESLTQLKKSLQGRSAAAQPRPSDFAQNMRNAPRSGFSSRLGSVPVSPSASSEGDSTAGGTTTEAASDELLYEGKNLTTWLDLLVRERQLASIRKSIDAVGALSSEKEWPRIRQSIWDTLPKWNGLDQRSSPEVSTSTFRTSLSMHAFFVLRKSCATPDVFEKEIVEKWVSPEVDDSQKQLLSRLVQLGHMSERIDSPLMVWLDSALASEDLVLKEVAAEIVIEWLFRNNVEKGVREKLVEILEGSRWSENDFWFRYFPVASLDIERLNEEAQGRMLLRVFPDAIARVNVSRMFDIMLDETSSERDFTQAMVWLAELPELSTNLEAWGLAEKRRLVRDRLKVLFTAILQSGDLGKFVSLESRLVTLSYPKLWGRTHNVAFDLYVVDTMIVPADGEDDVAQSLLVEKCLLCIANLGLLDDFKEERIAILKRLAPNVAQFYLEVDHVPVKSIFRRQVPKLTWPPLEKQVEEGQSQKPPVVIQKANMIAYLLWQSIGREFLGEDVLTDEWLPELQRHWCEALLKKLDQDGMGVTKEEFEPFAEAHRILVDQFVPSLDSNSDGRIEVDELMAWPSASLLNMTMAEAIIRKASEPLPEDADPKWVIWVTKKISAADRNQNGYLDSAEWSPSDGDFSKVDRNSDRRITLTEYYEFRLSMRKK